MKSILVIHGPNLNLLGTREPEKYGNLSSETLMEKLRVQFSNIRIDYFQSNSESEIIEKIQNSKNEFDGFLINAAAFSHTSIAIADAIRSTAIKCLSIHITNIYQREGFRKVDIVGEACLGSIVGLGTDGYPIAVEHLLTL